MNLCHLLSYHGALPLDAVLVVIKYFEFSAAKLLWLGFSLDVALLQYVPNQSAFT